MGDLKAILRESTSFLKVNVFEIKIVCLNLQILSKNLNFLITFLM